MNQILEPPLEAPKAGLEFDYSRWSPDTEVTLVNVPWTNTYADVWAAPSFSDVDKYLNSRPHRTIRWLSRAKLSEPIRIPLPYTEVMKYNYIAVRNGAYPTGGDEQKFYYFIIGVRDVAPSTTEIQLELDVWQTFRKDVSVDMAYIERGHVGIANANDYQSFGQDYLCVPEGLDFGGEYRISGIGSDQLMNLWEQDNFDVLCVSSIDLTYYTPEGDPQAEIITPQPMTQQGLPSGLGYYLFPQGGYGFAAWLYHMRRSPHVTRGILAAYIIPSLDSLDCYYQTWASKSFKDPANTNHYTVEQLQIYKIPHRRKRVLSDWREVAKKWIPEKYQGLNKFYTSPYCVIELTSHAGQPLVLKPENLGNSHVEVSRMISFAPPSPRIEWMPWKYNAAYKDHVGYDAGAETDPQGFTIDDGGEWDDAMTGIVNFPSVGVVNDGYMDYMLSNKNSIAYQYQSADWSQQKAMTANQLSYDQAGASMNLTRELLRNNTSAATQSTQISNQAAWDQSMLSAANSAVGLMGNIAAKNVGGAISSVVGGVTQGISTGINTNAANRQTALSNATATRNTQAQLDNANYMRDTNKQYADFAAKGDYANTIGAIQAKTQDAKMIQPSVSGQIGGDAFVLATQAWRVTAKVKIPNLSAIRSIGDYWLRYGYAINSFVRNIPRDLMVMEKFTYWKMQSVYMSTATCPEQFRQALRGILEKGVTVWRNPDDIGRIALEDNKPVKGVYY